MKNAPDYRKQLKLNLLSVNTVLSKLESTYCDNADIAEKVTDIRANFDAVCGTLLKDPDTISSLNTAEAAQLAQAIGPIRDDIVRLQLPQKEEDSEYIDEDTDIDDEQEFDEDEDDTILIDDEDEEEEEEEENEEEEEDDWPYNAKDSYDMQTILKQEDKEGR